MRYWFLLCLILVAGCATVDQLTPADNQRLEDELERMRPNPVPPEAMIPRR